MKTLLVTLFASFATLLAGESRGAPLRIVTTTSDLAALATAVAGDLAEVHAICTGKEDPHMIQAKPGFILKARDADLWIRIGLELEIGWEPPILDGSRNPRIRPGTRGHLDASESALLLDVPRTTVTRAMGDVHPMGNPHYWLDPLNARRIVQAMALRLAELDPAHAPAFRANAAAFQQKLDERMFGADPVRTLGAETLWAKTQDGTLAALLADARVGGWVARLKPLRGRKIVTYHKSWIYFSQRFGMDVTAELEPMPGIPPTAAHLAEVGALMKSGTVALVLQEPFYSVKAARKVTEETGVPVVVAANSVGGEPGTGDYLALMDRIVEKLTAAIKE